MENMKIEEIGDKKVTTHHSKQSNLIFIIFLEVCFVTITFDFRSLQIVTSSLTPPSSNYLLNNLLLGEKRYLSPHTSRQIKKGCLLLFHRKMDRNWWTIKHCLNNFYYPCWRLQTSC